MNKNLIKAIFLMLGLLVFSAGAYAAKPNKTGVKDKVILMPLVLSEDIRGMDSQMMSAVVQGLAQKYEVFSGERVLQALKKAASKENARTKKNCDETRCLEDLAADFNTDIFAMVHVNRIDGGYLLSISIRDVLSDKSVYDNSLPCEGCNAFKVIDKLKELVGVPAGSVVAEPAQPARGNDRDSVLWTEAERGNTLDDYQVYLDTFPKGKYAPFAKARIKKLKEEALAAEEQKDQQAWNTAQQENTETSFGEYLQRFPNGQFAGLAKSRSKKLAEARAQVEQEDKQAWESAQKQNTSNAYDGYLKKFPGGIYSTQAREQLNRLNAAAAPSRNSSSSLLGGIVGSIASGGAPANNATQFKPVSASDQAVLNAIKSGKGSADASIKIMAPDIAENGAVVPVEVSLSRPFNNGERLYLIVNDSYIGAVMTPFDLRAQIYFSTRVKMTGSGAVKAVLIDATGAMRVAVRDIRVTIGADPNYSSANDSCPADLKMRAASAGDVLDVKTLASCAQNPQQHIKSIDYYVDGGKVAEVALTPGASKNSFVGLKLTGRSGAQIEARARTSEGKSTETRVSAM